MGNFLDALKMIHCAAIFETYALVMWAVYITDVWELGIAHAAGLINIWIGITKIMPLIFLFLIDHNIIRSYPLLVIATTSSAMGMGFLSISTPSWLYSMLTGSCSEYKMKCIDETQQSLFYLALILIMIGTSARVATMRTLNFKGNATEQESMKHFVTSDSASVIMKASFLVLTTWSIIFGVSSVSNIVALFLLMGKSWSHKLYINKPERSPLTSVLKVLLAFVSKISLNLPYESAGFNQEIITDDVPLRRSASLRFLEKAAIRRPNDKGRTSRLMLCSLQEVEEAKTLVRMLPVGVMVVFLTLISSIGSTYFLQQAKRMKPFTVFSVEVTNLSSFVWLHMTIKARFLEEETENLKHINTYENKKLFRSRTTDAMVYAVLCCVIAALVEKSRLGVIRKHGLASKPGETIPMTILWLLPQFYVLGCFDASFERIIQIFLAEDIPLPMKNFKVFVLEGLIGVGAMSNVLVVYLVGKISEIGGRPNWFQHDTENSRFDLFYWVLTVLCVIVSIIWHQVTHI